MTAKVLKSGGENKKQRKHERKRFAVRVFVKGKELRGVMWFHSDNLSLGGLYIVSDFLLEKGTELTLSFSLSAFSEPIRIPGRVAWVNSNLNVDSPRRPPGMGIEFLDLDRETEDSLSTFVRKKK